MTENFGENIEITPAELAQIRAFDDFDLTMLLSEIHDHGWPVARVTLAVMPGGKNNPVKS